MANVAIIPARGGSKRIPNKNIRMFCGNPVIHYAISAAKESTVFDRVIVSTDSEKIADVATEHGAEVPFMRPAELADDHATTLPVIQHAIREMERLDLFPQYVCCIYPAAPLIRSSDIRVGLQKLTESADANFAFPVTTFPFPIFRAFRIKAGRVGMFWPENEKARSQDLEEAWHDAGQFYWGRRAAWLTSEHLYSQKSIPVPVPRYRVQDVDTEEDWMHAELMYRALQENGWQ